MSTKRIMGKLKSELKEQEEPFEEVLQDILEENLNFVCENGSDWYLKGDISSKKLKNVSKVYGVDEEDIVGLVDFTILGNGKAGVVFTTEGIYYKEQFKSTGYVYYRDIRKVEIIDREKKSCDDELLIYSNDEGTWEDNLASIFLNKEYLAELIQEIVEAYPKEKAVTGKIPIENVNYEDD